MRFWIVGLIVQGEASRPDRSQVERLGRPLENQACS